jgi:hypothetical protein
MATAKWETPAASANVLTTELNTLGIGANKITTTAVSNDQPSELYIYADFTLYLATQGTARSSGARVDLYILPRSDGTNYPYGGDSLDPSANHWVGSFLFDATTTARYEVIRGILLPPEDFHVLVMNETGQLLAASGNILSMRRYNMQSV